MVRTNSLIRYLLGFALLFVLFSCSSSRLRYRRTNKPQVAKNNDGLRFTSANDSLILENEFDVPPVEDHPVNTKKIVDQLGKINITGSLTPREILLLKIIDYINSPYKYGGTTKRGIDCSAFTQNVFKQSLNIKLPRTASRQYLIGAFVKNIPDLKFGDLIFFNTTARTFPGHVGIYLGSMLFAHSSVSHGVTISSLESSYYKRRFVGGRRILKGLSKQK